MMPKKRNESKDLVPINTEGESSGVIESPEKLFENQRFELLVLLTDREEGFGREIKSTANSLGYSDDDVTKDLYRRLKSKSAGEIRQKWREDFPRLFRDANHMLLGDVFMLQREWVETLKRDPSKLTPSLYKAIRDVMKVSGVLADAPTLGGITVNLGEAQDFVHAMFERKGSPVEMTPGSGGTFTARLGDGKEEESEGE